MGTKLGHTTSRRSANGFEQIPDIPYDGMTHSNDATIDIPLTETTSRKWDSSNEDEKHGINPGRRRRVDSDINDVRGKAAAAPDDGTINTVGRIYQAIYNFSLITRYMIYVLPVGCLIAIPIIIGATAEPNAKIGGVHITWFFAWFEVVWVGLWVCKIFAKVIPYIFQTLCGIVSSGTRKYALILKSLELPLTLVFWCIVNLVTFLPVMSYNADKQASGNTSVASWEKSVKNILFALLVCSLIYLVEKAAVQLISISYHRKQFDLKIKESKHHVFLVTMLFEASRKMFPMYCREFEEEDIIISDPVLAQVTHKSKRSSMMPLRMVQNVGRAVGQNVSRMGDRVQAAVGNVATELTGKAMFNGNAAHSIVIEALERKRCAAALARRIWMSFVVEGRESLFIDDIVEVLGPEHEADAEDAFAMLDRDGNGDISLDEMILAVTELGRQRKALNHSMHDVDQAINVLDNLLLCFAGVIGVLVFISFVTTGFGTVIAAAATSLLSASFVFATTAQEVLGSCVFLFVKHPFDIGDHVCISDKEYVVERISLLFSVFRTVADSRMTQVPNNILNSLWIDNFTRANAMHEQLTVACAFDTSFAEIEALRGEMEVFVRDKDNSRDFQPDFNIEVVGVGDMDKLELRADIRHKSNWSNEIVRAARRSKFMCALVLAMRKVKIRAPGVAAEEESKDGDDKDDKDDKPAEDGGIKPAAAANGVAAAGTMSPDTARASGFDQNQNTGKLTQRGSANNPDLSTEAAIASQLNARPPIPINDIIVQESGLQRVPTGASSPDRNPDISRALSTGQRKAGTRASQQGGPFPSQLPVPAGLTQSNSNVPILNDPAPPGSRGSARYEPPAHATGAQSNPIIGSPDPNTYNTSYYSQTQNHQNNTYESIPLGGIYFRSSPRATPCFRPDFQQPLPGKLRPRLPSSIYSPPQPDASSHVTEQPAGRRQSLLARTFRRGKDQSPYAEHEA
ncbi:hypothetical protein N7468_005348 [Penicillium chermesinum]|uniref:EF-hand domain-containing protein n=1 Tax=Penicillium chermesinum TaxID=63820 RepID=A0A9W9P1H1_9EURO|nr:uncharacterized protein N7468_005348 [Penicillium chermesinum]KAJ5232392.1 hypothetical protein N7468_005348 [Penicillium chermesinum]